MDNIINKINICLLNKQYSKAFGLLILELECLDEKERTKLIDFYSENLIRFAIIKTTLLLK